ncbi:MAG: DUF1080 domain-containing protein [Planctomycetia bacterium]|nr:DUF1080 domain-containing protein [Planctomycetia bacterium]
MMTTPTRPGDTAAMQCRPTSTTPSVALAAALLVAAAFAGQAAEPADGSRDGVLSSLPDVLAGPDGIATTVDEWRDRSRPHQLRLLERLMYGRRLPPVPVTVVGEVERAAATLEGDVPAVRLQARLQFGAVADVQPAVGTAPPVVEVLLYLPTAAAADRPVPVFLELNFRGNHAQHPDPAIRLSTAWMPADVAAGIVDHRATESSRGANAGRWPVEAMLARGFGMATAYCGDVFPDRTDGRPASCMAWLGRPVTGEIPPDEPGAIGAWAWQLSRILDWLVTLPEVDPGRVIVVGHSRLGKTALWAAACDERFAMVVSNESGCGGAALARDTRGETVAAINRAFPHWFCPTFARYAGREAELPCDQHVLLAMAAPRPLLVASAEHDQWADPRGEFLAAVAAEPAWRLFGLTGLGTREFPPPDTPVGHSIGYHVRSGRHDLLEYDWQRFADFAERHLLGRTPPPADGYPAFHPQQATLPAKPPADAIVLFGDGSEAEPPRFTSTSGGPIDWPVHDGSLVVRDGPGRMNHVVSTVLFRDAEVHAEFLVPSVAGGNSGLYLHGQYEMQIADTFGVLPTTDQCEGALYRFARPLVNAALPAGRWQVYDVRFIAPRRNAAGAITTPGSVTAWLNGRIVQSGLRFAEPRSPYTPYRYGTTDYLRSVERRLLETGEGPLFLQEHGSPVRFRNVWIRRLGP